MSERGFAKSNNLRESETGSSDVNILNNLGGGNVAEDIRLFSNNLRNESVLPSNSYDLVGDMIQVVQEGFIAFSNNTEIALEDDLATTYTVTESNGIDQFKLTNSAGEIVTLDSPLDMIRSDAVTEENIANLRVDRLETTITIAEDEEAEDFAVELTDQQNVFDRYTISENYSIADQAVSLYQFKRSQSLVNFRDNNVDVDINSNGYLRITNDDDVPRSQSSPGLFIVSNDGSTIRAFEDDSNPWEESGTALQTTSVQATINNLILSNPSITLDTVSSESGLVSDFTHLLPVTINGEQYQLLLIT